MLRRITVLCAAVLLSGIVMAEEKKMPVNLLRNPEFAFSSLAKTRTGEAFRKNHVAACWNADTWGDIEVLDKTDSTGFHPSPADFRAVRILPGKRLWQFAAFPEIGCGSGDTLSLSVQGFQESPDSLRVSLSLMRVESADDTWSPKEFGCGDKRTFSRHGRGELLRDSTMTKTSGPTMGNFAIQVEGLKIEGNSKQTRESSAAQKNTVGVLVELENVSAKDAVLIASPCLSKGPHAMARPAPGRPIPDDSRRIPRTIEKLRKGEPIHILALGSSIDRGSANPPNYAYDEDPKSPRYRQPLCDVYTFDPAKVNRPDLKGYVTWSQHYFMYTGRLRLELMRKFNYPVNRILLNVMACDGSCVGESHSGFADYADFKRDPSPDNGHASGKKWTELYPDLFRDSKTPPPDLVIFGHGHNERIDIPDGCGVYEGAIRWFQRRYPGVEFLFCMYHDKAAGALPPIPQRIEMANHYGIPYIDITPVMEGLRTTCNYFALAPDGGHAQASAHYIWFKQIEQAFEITDPAEPGIPQRRLPERYSPYAYGWEGDMVTFTAPHPRIVGPRMIIEDCAFNVWAVNGDKTKTMKIRIDGTELRDYAGRGGTAAARDIRNSSFVHGRLSLGDRHLFEILGENQTIKAVDCKVCPNRTFIDAASPRWEKSEGAPAAAEFSSEWGAPYGTKTVELKPGKRMNIEVEASDLSVAYADQPDGGTLCVLVDGKERLAQPANVPFVDSEKKERFIENRRGITGLGFGKHAIQLDAKNGPVKVLGLFAYDSRASAEEKSTAGK